MKKYRKIFIAVLAAFISFASACLPVPRKQTHEYNGFVLETELYGDNASVADEKISAAAQSVYSVIMADEQKFNACEGNVSESGKNVLDETEYTVATEVGRHTYECFQKAKHWYVRSNYAYNVADKRLRSLYGSDKPFPTSDAVLREINGLQTPLLVEAYTQSGRFYLGQYITFAQDGAIDDEHTYLGFDNIIDGYTLDCLAPIMTESAVYGKITVGSTSVYCGNDPRSKTGEWCRTISIEEFSFNCDIRVSGGEFVSVKSIAGSYDLPSGLCVGGVIDPVTGLPTTVAETPDGFIGQASDYVLCAAVIGSSGADCQALSFAACVRGVGIAQAIRDANARAVIVMRSGTVYTIGDAQCSRPDGYELVRL